MNTAPFEIRPFDKGSTSYRVKRYRERAEELRAIAQDLKSDECQNMLVRLANSYEQMADQADVSPRLEEPPGPAISLL